MKKIYLSVFSMFMLLTENTKAQCTTNYLINPSFESPVQPLLNNNNFPAPNNTFGSWTIPGATAGVAVGGFNVIRVNGGGYGGGPNTANGAGNQYVDINSGGGFVQQRFTITCASTIVFSGWFSRREAGGTGFTSEMDVINSSNTVVATSSNVSFTSNESEEVWKQVTSTPVALLSGTYTLRFKMNDFANCDNAFLCIDPGCVLATNVANFTYNTNACTANFKWTASEQSSLKNYELQTSTDGIIFKTVATVLPKNERDYSFSQAVVGTSFYRLKINDNSNDFTYSKILPVTVACNDVLVNVYPNPATDFLAVNMSNANARSLAVLINVDGKILSSTTLINGVNTINIKHLLKGLYVVKILNGNTSKIYKITKL